MPKGKWEFGAEVAECFDDMLARSIPGYEDMRFLTAFMTARYAGGDGVVFDIGCSRGGSIRTALEQCQSGVSFVGCDVSVPMIESAMTALSEPIAAGRVKLFHGLPSLILPNPGFYAVIQAVLTLQFVPIEERARLVADIYASLRPGGAFIVVEKLLGHAADIDQTLVDVYYDHKRSHGYTDDAIAAKRKSLSGVLVPLPEQSIREWLLADFHRVECYWRWANFAAYLAVKPGLG